jgi:hypothetical protein
MIHRMLFMMHAKAGHCDVEDGANPSKKKVVQLVRHKIHDDRNGLGTIFRVQSTRDTDHNDKALDWVFAECSLLILHIKIAVYFIYPPFLRDRQPRFQH